MFDNTVGNSLIVQNNTGAAIRLRSNEVGLSGGGSILVQDNTTSMKLLLVDNYSHNSFNCTGNVPAPTGSGNTADNGLNDQCATLG